MNAPASADYLRSLSRAAVDRRLLIFAGAGMSMLPPSRSPSWWEIYVGAAQALADRFKEGFPELASQVELDALLKPLANQQLADLIVQRFAGPTFVNVLKVVDIADPNENRGVIASLVARGSLRACSQRTSTRYSSVQRPLRTPRSP